MKGIIGVALVVWLLLSLRLRQHPLALVKRLPRLILLSLFGFFLITLACRLGKMAVIIVMIGGLAVLIPAVWGIMKGRDRISS